jgi:hypothetical protein
MYAKKRCCPAKGGDTRLQDSGFKKKDRWKTNIPQEQFVYTRGGEPKVMKKVVNSVLASALALTVAPMAFAAEQATNTEAPKVDESLQKVVNRLNALGLVAGYGNGDFGVDKTITRAEFATLVVRMRGLEQGAKLAQYQSNFTDVKTSDWFAGFVNVAAGQEIVKGFPNKTFKPQNQVTYAEAVTMIIRALGYEPSVKGVWPNNMIAKASELNIAKSITTPNNAATRGDIFKMMDNALRVKLMEQVEYGTDIRFNITDETLLTRYLDVEVRDMEWARDQKNDSEDLPMVANVPVIGLGTLKPNEVTLNGKNAGLGTTTYKVADGINPNEFAGQHVQVWIKDDKENTIVWMEGSEDEEVIMDRLSTFYLNDKEITDGDQLQKDSDLENLELELDGSGKTYRFSEDVKVTYNFKPYTDAVDGLQDIIDANNADGGYTFSAKIVLNDQDEISYIHVIDDQTLDKNNEGVKYGSEVIEKIDADKKRIDNLGGGTFTKLKDLEEGKDFLVFIDNKPAKLADLKPMDVYSVYYADGKKEKLLVFANRTVVEGKVDKVVIKSGEDNRLTIGDKTYRFREGSTYSDNANKDITKLDKSNWDKIRDLDGEEVKLYLDASGRIRHIETKDSVDDRRFKAILTVGAEYRSGKYEFTVLTENGKELDLALKAEDIEDASGKDFDGREDELEQLFKPSKSKDKLLLLEVTLDSKGEPDKVEILDTDLKQLSGDAWDKAADEDDEAVNEYKVTDDTAIFDMTGELKTSPRYELKDADVLKFKDIADEDDLDVFYTVNEDEEVEAIFVVKGDNLGSEMLYGQISSLERSGGDKITVVTKDGDSVKEKTFNLDGDAEDLIDDGIREGDFIAFSLNSNDEVIVDDVVEVVNRADDIETADFFADGKYEPATAAQLDDAALHGLTVAQVTDVDGNKITYEYKNGDKTEKKVFYVGSSTAYINAEDTEPGDGVDNGDYIILVETDDDGTNYDYVLVVASEDTVEEGDLSVTNFLKQAAGGAVIVDPGFDAIPDDVTGSKARIIAVTAYELIVDLNDGVQDSDIKSAELTVDGKTYQGKVENGKITFEFSSESNAATGTLVVTSTKDEKDTADVTFEDKL